MDLPNIAFYMKGRIPKCSTPEEFVEEADDWSVYQFGHAEPDTGFFIAADNWMDLSPEEKLAAAKIALDE